MNPVDAPIGICPAVVKWVMLPQCPIWMPAAAPSRCTASVIPRSPGTISGRSHNCLSNDSPLRHTAA